MGKLSNKELENRIKELEILESERRKIEQTLREREEKYRSITENITVGIYRCTAGSSGRFIEVNPAMVKMLVYKNKDELMAISVSEIYQNPKNRSIFSKKVTRFGYVKNEELTLKKEDGTPIIVSDTAIAVKDENNNVLYFDGIVEDITDRKK